MSGRPAPRAPLLYDEDRGIACSLAPTRPVRPISAENVAAAHEMFDAWKAWMEAKAVHDTRKARFDRLMADNPLAHLYMSFALVAGDRDWSAE